MVVGHLSREARVVIQVVARERAVVAAGEVQAMAGMVLMAGMEVRVGTLAVVQKEQKVLNLEMLQLI